ncbi:MAG TPA: DUF2333 family protein, partial [Gammaproteobacteria bacterium]
MDKQSKFKVFWQNLGQTLLALPRKITALYHITNLKSRGILWSSVLLLGTALVALFIVGIFWSQEPDTRSVRQIALEMAGQDASKIVPGFTTTAAEIFIVTTLLDKPGGYLSNDIFPPTAFFGAFQLLDNIPNW